MTTVNNSINWEDGKNDFNLLIIDKIIVEQGRNKIEKEQLKKQEENVKELTNNMNQLKQKEQEENVKKLTNKMNQLKQEKEERKKDLEAQKKLEKEERRKKREARKKREKEEEMQKKIEEYSNMMAQLEQEKQEQEKRERENVKQAKNVKPEQGENMKLGEVIVKPEQDEDVKLDENVIESQIEPTDIPLIFGNYDTQKSIDFTFIITEKPRLFTLNNNKISDIYFNDAVVLNDDSLGISRFYPNIYANYDKFVSSNQGYNVTLTLKELINESITRSIDTHQKVYALTKKYVDNYDNELNPITDITINACEALNSIRKLNGQSEIPLQKLPTQHEQQHKQQYTVKTSSKKQYEQHEQQYTVKTSSKKQHKQHEQQHTTEASSEQDFQQQKKSPPEQQYAVKTLSKKQHEQQHTTEALPEQQHTIKAFPEQYFQQQKQLQKKVPLAQQSKLRKKVQFEQSEPQKKVPLVQQSESQKNERQIFNIPAKDMTPVSQIYDPAKDEELIKLLKDEKIDKIEDFTKHLDKIYPDEHFNKNFEQWIFSHKNDVQTIGKMLSKYQDNHVIIFSLKDGKPTRDDFLINDLSK